jgi:cobalt-zinc-cadmium efflux system protein
MVVAFIGILINGGTALLFMKGQEDLNVKSAFMHLAYDAIISLGVVIAAGIIYFTGWHIIDPIVGLIITVTIFWGAWGLLRDSTKLVMDAVPSNVDLEAVKNYLANITGVSEVHDLHVWGMSTRENALTAHLVMPEQTLNDQDRQAIGQALLKEFNIHHTTIQIEQGNGDMHCDHHACS